MRRLWNFVPQSCLVRLDAERTRLQADITSRPGRYARSWDRVAFSVVCDRKEQERALYSTSSEHIRPTAEHAFTDKGNKKQM